MKQLWIGWALISVLLAGQSLGQSRIKALEDIAWQRKVSRASNMSALLLQARARSEQQHDRLTPWVRMDADHKLQTYMYIYTFGAAEQAELDIRDVDIEWISRTHDVVQAWIPMAELEAIAALPFVQRLTPPHYGTLPPEHAVITKRGQVTTEGDTLLFAQALRDLGFDGAGARIAVIADGANNHADAMATGDLPPDVALFGFCAPTATISCNVGTAMLEIIHDLAPGAELAIGALNFEQGSPHSI